ncbi:MAG: RNB domain-containing ribonuclease [Gammaproteobacteria bacterium]|nr:RNB domain-containing ribonuclease [Gammaproteobacteria bacterium]
MSAQKLQINGLVLYKSHPARVLGLADKVEIELEGGKTKRVRDKDVIALHPGPVRDLAGFSSSPADVAEAWELLEGEETAFADLLNLVFADPSPQDAWSLWLTLADGLWFEGGLDSLKPRSAEQIDTDRNARAEKARKEQAWAEFLERIQQRRMLEEDRSLLSEVERVALGQMGQSRIMEAIGLTSSPENAHRLLVELCYWPEQQNPHPSRQGLVLDSPELAVPTLAEEAREDLSHLSAWAIDDEFSNDPDDAISFDGDRLWVHVADVAALVAADSALDQEARSRGANLYLPETISHMLPLRLTEMLGLGLQEQSPALSIGFRLSASAEPVDIQICASRIRASRISYAEANRRLEQEPFASIRSLTERYRNRRQQAGAVGLDLPEVSVRVIDGKPQIKSQEKLDSREMVTDAMLMAGEAVANYCLERQIAVPFAVQAPPDELRSPSSLAQMFAYRRFFKPTRSAVEPGLHSGLGLERYVRATSPLRRYPDLLVHQQLRAHLSGREPLSLDEISLRASQSDEGAFLRRRTERLSNQHWKLVWLQQNPDWKGRGVVVEQGERHMVIMIPELAFEARMRLKAELNLDDQVQMKVREINLPEQLAYFRLL